MVISNAVTARNNPAPVPIMTYTPQEVVENATTQAKLLMDIVEKTKCYQEISSKKYLQVEAWETIGAFNRTHGETAEITPILRDGEIVGYNAHVQLWKDGMVVGGAVMPCFFTENCCKGKDGDARHKSCMSAAQTFATSKAYRMNFSYVAILAGYQPMPAEEITSDMVNGNGHGQGQTSQSEHWCKDHKTAFFKRGKMKAFAHPIKDSNGQDTGEWCHEHTEKEPEKATTEKAENSDQLFPRDPESVKTIGDLLAAAIGDFPEKFAVKDDVLRFLKKTEKDIVDPSLEYVMIATVMHKESK